MADVHRARSYVGVFTRAGVNWWKAVPEDATDVTARSCRIGKCWIVMDKSNKWRVVNGDLSRLPKRVSTERIAS